MDSISGCCCPLTGLKNLETLLASVGVWLVAQLLCQQRDSIMYDGNSDISVIQPLAYNCSSY